MRPPCILNPENKKDPDFPIWALIHKVKHSFDAAKLPFESLLKLLKGNSDHIEETLTLIEACCTPVSEHESYAPQWDLFFRTPIDAKNDQNAYALHCQKADFWIPANEPLGEYLARGGDLNAVDALGRSWLFFPDPYPCKRTVNHSECKLAFEQMTHPWTPDALGIPFFAVGRIDIALEGLNQLSTNEWDALAESKATLNTNALAWVIVFSFLTPHSDHHKIIDLFIQKGKPLVMGGPTMNLKEYFKQQLNTLHCQPQQLFPIGMSLLRLSVYPQPLNSIAKALTAAVNYHKKTPRILSLIEKMTLEENSIAFNPQSTRSSIRI